MSQRFVGFFYQKLVVCLRTEIFFGPRNFNAALAFVFTKKNLGRIPVLLPGFGRKIQVFIASHFFGVFCFTLSRCPFPRTRKKFTFLFGRVLTTRLTSHKSNSHRQNRFFFSSSLLLFFGKNRRFFYFFILFL